MIERAPRILGGSFYFLNFSCDEEGRNQTIALLLCSSGNIARVLAIRPSLRIEPSAILFNAIAQSSTGPVVPQNALDTEPHLHQRSTDAVSFARGSGGGVRVVRSVPGEDTFTMFCLWHAGFCRGDEIPGVGDFNADGRDDIVAFNLDNGDVFVGLSTVFGFWSDGFGETQSLWHSDFGSSQDVPLVGDFNGDGLDDIACFRLNDDRARVWVSLANPSTMVYDFHGGCLCEQAHFYLDGYSPSICP
jgi:hypothetical protein